MAKRDNSPPPEEGPPSNGWIISFSDCMTNLLCFFVLLVSFSSFDVAAQGRIQGAFTAMSSPAISDRKTDPTDAIIPPQVRPFDPTPEGAEKPTDLAPEPVRKTTHDLVPDIDAIHDQVTLRLPAKDLFYGAGDVLTRGGRENLRLIGSYMRMLPVRGVVRSAAAGGGDGGDLGLRRSWAVVSCICSDAQVSRDRMCITSAADSGEARGGEATVEILLVRKEAER